MPSKCSFTTSLSGAAANWLIEGRDDIIQGIYNDKKEYSCLNCTPINHISSGFIKLGTSLSLAVLFVVNLVEAAARLIFALITLPAACCECGEDFYQKVSVKAVKKSFDSLSVIAQAIFINVYQPNIQQRIVHDQTIDLGRALGSRVAPALFRN